MAHEWPNEDHRYLTVGRTHTHDALGSPTLMPSGTGLRGSPGRGRQVQARPRSLSRRQVPLFSPCRRIWHHEAAEDPLKGHVHVVVDEGGDGVVEEGGGDVVEPPPPPQPPPPKLTLPQWLLKALGPTSAAARKAPMVPWSAQALQEGCRDQPLFSGTSLYWVANRPVVWQRRQALSLAPCCKRVTAASMLRTILETGKPRPAALWGMDSGTVARKHDKRLRSTGQSWHQSAHSGKPVDTCGTRHGVKVDQ